MGGFLLFYSLPTLYVYITIHLRLFWGWFIELPEVPLAPHIRPPIHLQANNDVRTIIYYVPIVEIW